MKAHKYWSMGAFLSMLLACLSGCCMRSKKIHRYAALGALGCMFMSIYSGHRMVAGKKHSVPAAETAAEAEEREEAEE